MGAYITYRSADLGYRAVRKVLGDRIRLARRRKGYSLQALSSAIAGSACAQAIDDYERNESTPDSNVLVALAEALEVSVEYLCDRWNLSIAGLEFRAEPSASQQDRDRIEVEVLSWLDRYLQIEAVLGLDAPKWRSPLGKPPDSIEDKEIEQLAESLRVAWQLGTGPIPNMTELLESQGLRVLCVSMSPNISGLTCMAASSTGDRKFPALAVNQAHTLERRRFTLAHELGHRLLRPNDADATVGEGAVNLFAGAFLMPREHLLRVVGEHRNALSYQELVHVKRIYRVSGAALLNRLKELNVVSRSTVESLFQSIARDWRTSEPEELEPPELRGQFEDSQRFERLCYRALSEGLISPIKVSYLLETDERTIISNLRGAVRKGCELYHENTCN